MTPAEKYAAEKLNEAKRVNEIMKEVFDLECNIWWNSLAPEERQKIYAESNRQLKYESEKRAFREIYFQNNIFQFNPDTHSQQQFDKKDPVKNGTNPETDTSSIAKEHEKQAEIEFREMMDEPEGELYKQCFDRLNNFVKKKAAKGGPAFEGAMRAAFKKMMETSNDPDDKNNKSETKRD